MQKKRRTKRSKKKVQLDNKSVIKLTLTICILCAAFLIVNILFSMPEKKLSPKTEPNKISVAAKEKETDKAKNTNTIEPKKTEVKKTSTQQKTQDTIKTEKKETAKNTEKPKDSNSNQTKKTEVKKAESKKNSSESKTPTKTETKNTKSEGTKTASEKKSSAENKTTQTTQNKPEQETQKPAYEKDIPSAVNGAKIAFVIDDAGLSVENLKHYTSLPFPITIAILPRLSHSRDCAVQINASGQEAILHQPMQSLNLKLDPGPGAIKPDMTTFEIAETVKENIALLEPYIKGMNNHEGSLITENEIKIGCILDVTIEKGIYFLDSRTTAATKAPQAALERDINIYERDVFIDDIISRDEMLKQILRGINIANKKGKAIMIGHVDKSVKILPDLLKELYPILKSKGYTLTFVSRL